MKLRFGGTLDTRTAFRPWKRSKSSTWKEPKHLNIKQTSISIHWHPPQCWWYVEGGRGGKGGGGRGRGGRGKGEGREEGRGWREGKCR